MTNQNPFLQLVLKICKRAHCILQEKQKKKLSNFEFSKDLKFKMLNALGNYFQNSTLPFAYQDVNSLGMIIKQNRIS